MRAVVALPAAIGAAALAFTDAPSSWLIALAVAVAGLILASGHAAVDIADADRAELSADALAVVAFAAALTQVTSGNRPLVAALFTVALAAQLLPRALHRRA